MMYMKKNKAVAKRLKRVVTGRHWLDREECPFAYLLEGECMRYKHSIVYKYWGDDLPF